MSTFINPTAFISVVVIMMLISISVNIRDRMWMDIWVAIFFAGWGIAVLLKTFGIQL